MPIKPRLFHPTESVQLARHRILANTIMGEQPKSYSLNVSGSCPSSFEDRYFLASFFDMSNPSFALSLGKGCTSPMPF